MPNRRHGDFHKLPTSSMPPKPRSGMRHDATPEKTAAWPGLPGSAQSRARDKSGTPKVRRSAKQEGL
jgi:hypothetical protein